MSLYAGSKAAVRQLVRTWIYDLKGSGIRMNVLSPGTVDTPSLRSALTQALGPERAQAAVTGIALRSASERIGTPREIGAVVAFLAQVPRRRRAVARPRHHSVDGGHAGARFDSVGGPPSSLQPSAVRENCDRRRRFLALSEVGCAGEEEDSGQTIGSVCTADTDCNGDLVCLDPMYGGGRQCTAASSATTDCVPQEPYVLRLGLPRVFDVRVHHGIHQFVLPAAP
jgi:hypothetical protein